MSTYIRIVDNRGVTLVAYKDAYYGRDSKLTTREYHIKQASNYTKKEAEDKCSYLKYHKKEIEYPIFIQVINKIKYKNGNITKKIIYEKRIDE